MAIFGILISIGSFMGYFCLKYTYAARANSYSIQPSLKDVWSFSFAGHPMRRNVVPFKYIAIFFAFTALFGWDYNLNREDVVKILRICTLALIYLNHWTRMAIYEATHWQIEIEKNISAFQMLRRSIKEIGWVPQNKGWLSGMVNVTSGLLVFVCIVQIIFALYF